MQANSPEKSSTRSDFGLKKWPSNPALGWGISTQFCPLGQGIKQTNLQIFKCPGGKGGGKMLNLHIYWHFTVWVFMVCTCFIMNSIKPEHLNIPLHFPQTLLAYFFSSGPLLTSGSGGSGLKNSQQDSVDCTPVQQLVGFYKKKSHKFIYLVGAFYLNSFQS